MRPRIFVILLFLVSAIISLHALNAQDKDTQSTKMIEFATSVEGGIGPNDFPENINPLTGLEVENPEVLNRRPIIVKVSNSPALVRPQAGIGEADLVFEHYTEAGITRFSAIYYGNAPDRVGSIRSARLIDYELVPMYQGMLAFAGASIGVDKRIYGSEAVTQDMCQRRDDFEQCRTEVDVVGPPGFIPPSEFAERAYKGVLYGFPYYWRGGDAPAPHNLYVNPNALWELEEEGSATRPELVGMAFHPEPPEGASGNGTHLQVRYKTTVVDWYYDEEAGTYYRETDGQEHKDGNTQELVRADNVLVVYAGHYLTDIVESGWQGNVHWSKQITVWPEGDVLLLRDGKYYEGKWLRPSRPELMRFETDDGEILYLKPGNSWIQLVRTPEQMDSEREWVRVE